MSSSVLTDHVCYYYVFTQVDRLLLPVCSNKIVNLGCVEKEIIFAIWVIYDALWLHIKIHVIINYLANYCICMCCSLYCVIAVNWPPVVTLLILHHVHIYPVSSWERCCFIFPMTLAYRQWYLIFTRMTWEQQSWQMWRNTTEQLSMCILSVLLLPKDNKWLKCLPLPSTPPWLVKIRVQSWLRTWSDTLRPCKL